MLILLCCWDRSRCLYILVVIQCYKNGRNCCTVAKVTLVLVKCCVGLSSWFPSQFIHGGDVVCITIWFSGPSYYFTIYSLVYFHIPLRSVPWKICSVLQMYGRFTTTQLQKFAKDQAAKLRREESEAKKTRRTTDREKDDEFRSYEDSRFGAIKRELKILKQITVKRTNSPRKVPLTVLPNVGDVTREIIIFSLFRVSPVFFHV